MEISCMCAVLKISKQVVYDFIKGCQYLHINCGKTKLCTRFIRKFIAVMNGFCIYSSGKMSENLQSFSIEVNNLMEEMFI